VLPHEGIERAPVELGHAEIRENDSIAPLLELREGLPPIARRVYAVAITAQQSDQPPDHARLVVHNQNHP
jgi:hypothetical protein